MGARLVRTVGSHVRIGRIVEVEAYVGEEDEACHARFGPTARNAVMFGPPGHAYVYFVYGMYHCLNVVTELDGRAAALLVRAVEPLDGTELMRRARIEGARRHARGMAAERLQTAPAARLASGPGLVCAALSIAREHNGVDLCDPASPLHLEPASEAMRANLIATGPRIGIGYASEPWLSLPWRFWIAGNPAVSRTSAARRRPER